MKCLYKELYCSIEKELLNNTAQFVALRGSEYNNNLIKLMIIGRSVNGWDSLNTESAEAISDAAINAVQKMLAIKNNIVRIKESETTKNELSNKVTEINNWMVAQGVEVEYCPKCGEPVVFESKRQC